MHTGHRRHKHNMRQGLLLPSPKERPRLPPPAPECSQPSATRLGDQQELCREAQTRPPVAPREAHPCARQRPGCQGKPWESHGFPGHLLSVSLHPATAAPSQSYCGVVVAAPPWNDPSSTQACGAPARLSPDPILSSALARSLRALADPRAVAALVRPTPSQQGTRHPQSTCPCTSTPAPLVPWPPRVRAPLQCWGQPAQPHAPSPGSKGRGREPWLGKRGGPGLQGPWVLPEGMAKASSPCQRQGEGGESEAQQGLVGMQSLTSCCWERGEGN